MRNVKMDRRTFGALAAATIAYPTTGFAKTIIVSEPAKFAIEDGVLYQIKAPRRVWSEIVIDFGRDEMSLADYAEKLTEIGMPMRDEKGQLALARDPEMFGNVNAELAEKIRGAGEGAVTQGALSACVYACLILIYSCLCREE